MKIMIDIDEVVKAVLPRLPVPTDAKLVAARFVQREHERDALELEFVLAPEGD